MCEIGDMVGSKGASSQLPEQATHEKNLSEQCTAGNEAKDDATRSETRQQADGEVPAPAVEEGWQAAFDSSSNAWYYYNIYTGKTSWDPPPGWVPNTDEPSLSPAAAASGNPATTNPADNRGAGYYYVDAHGITQGPYSKDMLIAWRAALPMDLQVWYEDAGDGGVIAREVVDGTETELQGDNNNNGAPDEDRYGDQDTVAKSVDAGKGAESGQSDAHEPATDVDGNTKEKSGFSKDTVQARSKDRRRLLDLAQVTGDADALQQWREEHPDQASMPNSAPPATAYLCELNPQGDGFHGSWAEAALAGLPPDDDAVRLARAAAAAGKPLEHVVAWSHAQSDYASSMVHSAGRGRMQAVGCDGGAGGLYAEFSRHIDPRTVEKQLRRAAAKREMTAEEVRAAKQRKAEIKAKKARAWLQD
jgi:hypothetical protein